MLWIKESPFKDFRFIMVIIRSLPDFLNRLPRARYALRHPEKYTREQNFARACEIMDTMRKRARTTTYVYGKENIPQDETVVFYSNHQGKYDALGIIPAMDTPCSVLWEKEAASRLLGREVCALIEGVKIDLTDLKEKVRAILQTIDKIKKGHNMLIFPEGGYSENGNTLQEFKTGCFDCSIKTKTTIVPITIYDSYKSMNGCKPGKVKTQVHFLSAIPYEEYKDLTKQELCDLVKSRIAQKLAEIENR